MADQHIDDISRILADLMEVVAQDVKKQIELQGSRLTGKLIRSVEVRVSRKQNRVEGQIWLEFYGLILESGVSASRIPYTPSRRSARKVSKYIQGLIGYFRQRGLPDREARSAAFATATVHSREGMPTRASRRFSQAQGGARTGFLARAAENTEQFVVNALLDRAGEALELRILQSVPQTEKIVIK